MNAQGVRDETHLERLLDDPMYVAQEKLDGMRAVVHVTKDGLRIFSRSAGVNDPTKPLEKTSALPHLACLRFPGMEGSILDTEILIPGTDVAKLSGTVHRKETNGQNHLVKIFVFDILKYKHVDLMDKIYEDRLAVLNFIPYSRYISVLPLAYTPKDKRALYNSIINAGGEGIILKRLDAFYIPAARPASNWYKAKRSATFDCVAMGFTKGAGKYNNRIGAIKFGQIVDGRLVELGQASGMTDSVRTDMSTHPHKYIGKVITIKGMERLRSGAIRHPQYAGINNQKHPKECVWYPGEQ
jgi:ATP-dependent DNA ligase